MEDKIVDDGTDTPPGNADASEPYDTQFLAATLLVFVAKGDGTISNMETNKMLSLVGDYFRIPSAASLAP